VLLKQVKLILLREDGIDPEWSLEREVAIALQNLHVKECAFVGESGAARFHPDPVIDEFMFSTLGFYESILNSLKTQRSLQDPIAAADQAVLAALRASGGQERPHTGKRPSEGAPSDGAHASKHSRRLPEHADRLLKTWLLENVHHPFPDDDQKDDRALRTGLTYRQISNYFINARRRFLKTIRPKESLST
jgi:hypothetical protein